MDWKPTFYQPIVVSFMELFSFQPFYGYTTNAEHHHVICLILLRLSRHRHEVDAVPITIAIG